MTPWQSRVLAAFLILAMFALLRRYYVGGLTMKEVGRIQGRSEALISLMMKRIHGHLRKALLAEATA
jgi:hypothetical protein